MGSLSDVIRLFPRVHLTALALLLATSPAGAYQRKTHQHLTELGFAYLKAIDLCASVPLQPDPAEMERCVDRCRKDKAGLFGLEEEGYLCPCAKEACDRQCPGSGAAKYGCVRHCVDFGDGRKCLKGGATVGRCEPPYYWVPEDGKARIDEICGDQCHDDLTLPGSEECGVFDPVKVVGPDPLSPERARQIVSFYQGLSASACPPRTYKYHGQDANCTEALTGATKPLGEWDQAALDSRLVDNADLCDADDTVEECEGKVANDYLLPVQGVLLSAANPRTRARGSGTDLTGTILGYHSSVVDKLSDIEMGIRFFPVAQDALKTGAQIGVGLGGGALAAAVAVGGIVMCGLSCPVTIVFDKCDDCFEEGFAAASTILAETEKIRSRIEETDLLSVAPRPGIGDHDFTAFFHFMNFPPGFYDDVDGHRPLTAFGPGGALIELYYETSPALNTFVDVGVVWNPSKRALSNYQPQGADDGMEDSRDRGRDYWESDGFFNYVFPPMDNLAYYWWHKWLEGRDAKLDRYGLLPLGGVLHAVQDLTQPFHAWGISLQGHAPYETHVQTRLDPAVNDPKERPLLLDLNDPEQERLFLERVGFYLLKIRAEVLEPAGGVLHARRLLHFLYDEVRRAPNSVSLSDDLLLLSWIDLNIEDEWARTTGLPLAVAATVTVLAEGARPDLAPYRAALKLDLSEFERVGEVPPIAGASRPPAAAEEPELSEIPPQFAEIYPEWVCAGEQPRARAALVRYFKDKASDGRDLLALLLAEKTRCDLLAAGMPVPDDPALDEMGRYQAGALEATLRFGSHGSLPQLDQEMACNTAQAPWLSPRELERAAARCAGTLDSDGDGVLDQLDRCWTPRALSGRGLAVKPDGCVFTHEAHPQPLLNPFQPGAVRKEKP